MKLEELPVRGGFRLRGEQISRLETFVDAAFAFAITLLVISAGTLPQNVAELFAALKRIPTFAATFAIVAMFWWAHERWSRRYGLDGPLATVQSLALVFVTLIFVFPLRMVMSGAMHFFSGGWLPAEIRITEMHELQDCFLIYGLGFTVLNALIVWLYRHAWRRADELQLDPVERLETRRDIATYAAMAGVGLLSILLSFWARSFGDTWLVALPGMSYGLIGALQFPLHVRFDRELKRLERAT